MGRALPPLVLAAIALAAGILTGLRLSPPGGFLLVMAAAVPVAGWAFARPRMRTALLLAVGLLGATLGSDAAARWSADCRATLADGAWVEATGHLAASWRPEVWQRDRFASDRSPMLPFHPTTVRVDGEPLPRCTGTVRVRLPDDLPPTAAGSAFRIGGEWRSSTRPVVGGDWPRDPRLAGFLASETVEPVEADAGFRSSVLAMRGATEMRMLDLFPAHGSLMDGLVLGRREAMDPALRDRFARAGMAHFLAISGMHVGLIAGGIVLLVGFLRLPWRHSAGLALALIGFYLVVIGAPVSALRSGLMIALGLAGLMLQRPFAPLAVVAAAAIVILVHRPPALAEPGFQMSFAGVIGILLLRESILRRAPDAWQHGARRWFAEGVSASLAAFLATAPIAAYHFGVVAPVSVLMNLPGTALLAVALAAAGIALPLSLVAPPVAALIADAGGMVLTWLDGLAAIGAALPGGHFVLNAPQVIGAVIAAAAGLGAFALGRGMRTPLRTVVAAGTATAVLLFAPASPRATGGLDIFYLDVGQGDATAIRTPAGRWLMIDTGPVTDRFDAGERRVVPFLRRHGVTRLEVVILTHPHLDHYGGTEAVMREVEIGRILDPGMPVGTERYLRLLEAAETRGIPWVLARPGRTLRIDGLEIVLLWPDEEVVREEGPNEASVVAHVRYGDFTALFTGDAYIPQELELVRRHGRELRSDVLKAGHHGSRTSTAPRFLDVVEPGLVVVSAGRRNRYGHPHRSVLELLRARDIPVARTDIHGTIHIRVEEGGGRWRWIGGG